MELLMIGETKCKVTLTREDLSKYRLNPDGLNSENAESKNAVREILNELKGKTGFDPSERVLIRCYPSKDGGCEMFVTRLTEPAQEKEPSTARQSSLLVGRFTDFPSLCLVARALCDCHDICNSKLYKNEIGYSLVLNPSSESEKHFLSRRFSEFCPSPRLIPEIYLSEHETCILSEHALQTLSELADLAEKCKKITENATSVL
ncbi:MAG: adaptor protein MecA [Clostridia bacterium]|nr:adaptor protein MecA [Clostridia bacterium]